MRIAILTDFSELNDGYSLSRVVADQVEMLTRYGHDVTVFVSEDFDRDLMGEFPCEVDACVPVYEKLPYRYQEQLSEGHRAFAEKLAHLLVEKLQNFSVVFSHDWIFAGPKLALAESLRLCSDETRSVSFLHWIHSTPGGHVHNWWDVGRYGKNHRVVYPNSTDSLQVADLFRGKSSDLKVIPHITDLRTLFDFSRDTRELIDRYPGLLSAEFVEVFAADRARLSDKGLRNLILMFCELKKRTSVCLLVADSYTGSLPAEDLGRYKKMAMSNGLTEREFGFLSDFKSGKYQKCVPRRVLLGLMQCSSVNINPSRGEAFGLTIPETSLCSSALQVLNRSLSPMLEVSGHASVFVEFGSCERNFTPKNERSYFERIADIIYGTAQDDICWKSRNFMRRTYNYDAIYQKYYKPMFAEIEARGVN